MSSIVAQQCAASAGSVVVAERWRSMANMAVRQSRSSAGGYVPSPYVERSVR